MVVRDSLMGKLVDNANATVNAAIFSHPDIYEQEMEQVFARMWLFVGHESQIPKTGDFVRSRMGAEQVIVTRTRNNKINVLLNSCPHRGNMVCRYDEGNALAFQCSFHGWSFDNEGALINLPPDSEEAYAPDLRKEEWGMLKARVETFQGTIWATWDDSAPSLLEYFGGAEGYMAPFLADADGTPEGAEVAGGVMRWRVGLNWKVPMPDLDITHGWITHRSTRGLLGQPGLGGPPTASIHENSYHVWFPEGHTHSTRLGNDGIKDRDFAGFGDYPVLQEYLREKWTKRKERLGKLAGEDEMPHIFPNMGSTVGRILRVLHPQGPTETEMWSYIMVDKAMPPEVKDACVRYYERRWGPNGMIQKDDMENWYIQTQYSKGHMTRRGLRQNNQLGMSRQSLHGPSTFGLPGMFHPQPTDENYRRFFQRWAEVMEARDWDEMRITNPAK